MPRQPALEPRHYVVSGEWPDGAVEGSAAARYAAAITRRLVAALNERPGTSIRELARRAGLSHTTVNSLLAGKRCPDTKTLAALETALGRPLLPDWDDRKSDA